MPARVIGATGFKNQLPDDAHGEWRGFIGGDPSNYQYLWHAVVQTQDAIIDIAGGQYGAKYGGVRILTPAQFEAEWKSFKTHPEDYTKIKPVSSLSKKFKVN